MGLGLEATGVGLGLLSGLGTFLDSPEFWIPANSSLFLMVLRSRSP